MERLFDVESITAMKEALELGLIGSTRVSRFYEIVLHFIGVAYSHRNEGAKLYFLLPV